jgi:hypothetical protein
MMTVSDHQPPSMTGGVMLQDVMTLDVMTLYVCPAEQMK